MSGSHNSNIVYTSKSPRWYAVSVALLAAGVVLSGCGGGGNSGRVTRGSNVAPAATAVASSPDVNATPQADGTTPAAPQDGKQYTTATVYCGPEYVGK